MRTLAIAIIGGSMLGGAALAENDLSLAKAKAALRIDTINRHFDIPENLRKPCFDRDFGDISRCLIHVIIDEPTIRAKDVATLPFAPGVEMLKDMIADHSGSSVATDAWSYCQRESPPASESDEFRNCMAEVAKSLQIDVRSDREQCEDRSSAAEIERCIAMISLERALLKLY